MKNIIDNTFKILFRYGLLLFVVGFILQSCQNDDLEIQQSFPFEVEVMPVQKYIAKGETVEIRCRIISTGNYAGTVYSIRYFQSDGAGNLRLFNDPPFVQNDFYSLTEKEFRLYYTSESTVSQSFNIWISDNMGNKQTFSFQFNPRSAGTL